jgi:hypothetical protein
MVINRYVAFLLQGLQDRDSLRFDLWLMITHTTCITNDPTPFLFTLLHYNYYLHVRPIKRWHYRLRILTLLTRLILLYILKMTAMTRIYDEQLSVTSTETLLGLFRRRERDRCALNYLEGCLLAQF